MTKEKAIQVSNILQEIEGLERAIDGLPMVAEFEDITKTVYDKLYEVLNDAKVDAEKRLEEM